MKAGEFLGAMLFHVRVVIDPAQEPVKLDCDVEVFDFSGHAPREHILEFIKDTGAAQNILVHGDPAASRWFADQLDGPVLLKSGAAHAI